MPFYFKVYAKVTCDWCAKALILMDEMGFDHSLTLIDKAQDYYEDLKNKYEHQSVPMVVKVNKVSREEEFIGGCDDFVAWLKSEGYEC